MSRFLPALLIVLACSDGTGPIDYTRLSLSIVEGQAQRDTVMKRLPGFLAVEVLAEGNPTQGVLVNFVVLDADCGQPYVTGVLTNASGRAQNFWDLGTLAGPCTMEARAITPSGQPVSYGTFTATADPGPLVHGWSAIEGSDVIHTGSLDLNAIQSRQFMEDPYGNKVHWRIDAPAYAHPMSSDSTSDESKRMALDSVGTTLARIIYAGQTICRPTLTVSQNGQDGLMATLSTPPPRNGGCAGTL